VPDWSAGVWTALGLGLAVLGLLITVIAWQFPRHPRKPAPAVAGQGSAGPSPQVQPTDADLVIEVENHMPVYDLPDGSRAPGDWLLGVTLYNRGTRRVCVSSWGVRLPDGGNIVTFEPVTPFEPRLPHWVEPGTNGTWYLEPAQVRRIASERGANFDDMRAWVSLADGRRVTAGKGVPLE